VTNLARAWFDLVFGIGVRLLVRYGIVLEPRQRSTALVLDPATGGLRLLVRDFAGTRIRHSRLLAALGDAVLGDAALEKAVPPVIAFRSEGMLTESDEELSDAFTMTTVHQCGGRDRVRPRASQPDPRRGSARDQVRATAPIGAPGRAGMTSLDGAGGLTGPNYLRIPGGGW
jgi:hypothetical protein